MMISRSEIKNQTVFDSKVFSRTNSNSSSKGNIEKYTNGDIWIKGNCLGYESLAEVLSSRVAKALGITTVEYFPCLLAVNEYDAVPACYSYKYIPQGYSEISLGRLLQLYGGYDSSDQMYDDFINQPTAEARLKWVLKILSSLNSENWLLKPLAKCLWLDSIILNEDRHLFNIVFISKDLKTDFQLIYFDYGAALLSDLQAYSINMPVTNAKGKVKAKPFHTRFSKQLEMFLPYLDTVPEECITINITDLAEYYEQTHINRCLDVLKTNLALNNIQLSLSANITHYFS